MGIELQDLNMGKANLRERMLKKIEKWEYKTLVQQIRGKKMQPPFSQKRKWMGRYYQLGEKYLTCLQLEWRREIASF